MDSLLKFASGFSVEVFVREVYIKSNLTLELERVIGLLNAEYEESSGNREGANHMVIETPIVTQLCDLIEAILLHGLKEKFKVSSVFHPGGGVGGSGQSKETFSLDFWSVILIVCHNEESKSLKELQSIHTDIGRCRAWVRSALNEGLLCSYLVSLICDSALLNGFYRSSAYIRDSQQTEAMRTLMVDLDKFIFHLSFDNVELNYWSTNTLNYLGIKSEEENESLVVTALDAIHLISDNKTNKELVQTSQPSTSTSSRSSSINIERKHKDKHKEAASLEEEERSTFPEIKIEESQAISEKDSGLEEKSNEDAEEEEKEAGSSNYTGNSIKSGWSVQPMVEDESYNAILESYSTRAVLSSTPDISDLRPITITSPATAIGRPVDSGDSNTDSYNSADQGPSEPQDSSSSYTEFEIIPKIVMKDSDIKNQRFFDQLGKIAQENGLDEQDYKCNQCSRPIGMIYGKARLCHLDGHLYCVDCHTEEEAIIPAQVLFNWNFKRMPVAKHNRKHLLAIEMEPIFDLKLLSPLLYSNIAEMVEVLDLRTQLFFLHAYLFTCQESIALKMRKFVWPREHLFEHVHLYSLNDLIQVHNGSLVPTLREVIAFARKHVFGCDLCKLKGYYCEICNNNQILYSFDTDTTKRCEACQSVFHLKASFTRGGQASFTWRDLPGEARSPQHSRVHTEQGKTVTIKCNRWRGS